jgi:hypothetical protein
LRALAIVETNFEDLAQFIAFSMVFTAGISRPSIGDVAVSVLKVAGLLAFLAYTLLSIMRRLRVFVSRMDPLSKYLLFLSIALLYSVAVQSLGLPPLLGAFIAGVVLSEYAGSEELTIISGVRELGLLLYFSTLGAELALPHYSVSTSQLLVGVLVGLACVLIRVAALSLASTLGTLSPGSILPYAASLSSISETAIVFADALISQGTLPAGFKALTVLAVATSMLTSPVVYRGSSAISRATLPKRVRDITSSLSSLLLHSSNLIVEVGRDVVRFLITLLAVVYSLRIAVISFRYVPVLGALLAVASMAVGYVIIIVSFTRTLRRIYGKALGGVVPVNSVGMGKAAAKFVTVVITALSVILLIATLHTVLTEAGLPTQLHRLLTGAINAIAVALLMYMTLKELRRAKDSGYGTASRTRAPLGSSVP